MKGRRVEGKITRFYALRFSLIGGLNVEITVDDLGFSRR